MENFNKFIKIKKADANNIFISTDFYFFLRKNLLYEEKINPPKSSS